MTEPVKQVLTPATSLAQHPVISDGTLVQVPPIISEGQPTALYKVAVIWPKALRAKVRASNMAWYMMNNFKGGEVNRESTTMSGRNSKGASDRWSMELSNSVLAYISIGNVK